MNFSKVLYIIYNLPLDPKQSELERLNAIVNSAHMQSSFDNVFDLHQYLITQLNIQFHSLMKELFLAR